jgi:aminobutyraldehyde dehydrogenase
MTATLTHADATTATAATMPVISPVTGEQIAEVPAHTTADVDERVARAKAAFTTWGSTTPSARSAVLLQVADVIMANLDELVAIECRNSGKLPESTGFEIAAGADMVRFFAGAARRLDGIAAGEYEEGFTSFLRREPLGVVGVVAPWNYPFMLTCVKLAAVLAAGNTLVLKPADETPLSALRLAELLAGVLPEDVFSVVTGTGPVVGQRLAEHPDIALFALTGGTDTGRKVGETAGRHLKRVHLELGSKNVAIVLDDADLAEAAESIAMGAFVNAGQDCGAAGKVLVHAAVKDAFLELLTAEIDKLVVGDPAEEGTSLGPVISAAHQRRVLGFVERAQAEGGTVVRGGQAADRPGFFVQPTLVLADLDSEIAKSEVFGPVISVHTVESDEQALQEANNVNSGLAASVFTNDVRRALNATRRLDFGTTWVNSHIPMAMELPWGGFKDTGNGYDLSALALEQFTRVKHVMVKL